MPEEANVAERINQTLVDIGNIAPVGECQVCDSMRGKDRQMPFPWHKAITIGHRNHCTCDSCF